MTPRRNTRTSWHSLLACAQADVTLDRIAALAEVTGTEPLTVDFKEKMTPRIADCVAAMANGYGGLIFLGITNGDHKIVSVKADTMAYVADRLAARLDRPTGCRHVRGSAGPGSARQVRRSDSRLVSGAALLTASALTRFGVLFAGRASARDPAYTVAPQRQRLRETASTGTG